MELHVLYEDNHLIIVNKPGGELVQGDNTGDQTIGDRVKAYIKEKYQKPGEVFLGTVHRIDRPTSGIVVFARTSKALARMNEIFQTREVKKTYWAVTEKEPDFKEGHLIHFLTRNQEKNKSYASLNEKKASKKAELDYVVKGRSDNYFFIEVKPITGRHHQIRVQLSTIGCVIKGDLKYGAKRNNVDGSIHLHARAIEFIHPVSKNPIHVIAPPPLNDALWKAFNEISN